MDQFYSTEKLWRESNEPQAKPSIDTPETLEGEVRGKTPEVDMELLPSREM